MLGGIHDVHGMSEVVSMNRDTLLVKTCIEGGKYEMEHIILGMSNILH